MMENQSTSKTAYALAALRIVLGLTFLWAFFDKLFGLTYSTSAASSWLSGGHPTKGYLGSSFGPLGDLFKGMAGNTIVDVLFMAGLLGIGLALTFGFATRLASWAGLAMVIMMYLSHPVPWAVPHTPHPFLDDHVVDAAAFVVLALAHSGDCLGFGRQWRVRVKANWLQ